MVERSSLLNKRQVKLNAPVRSAMESLNKESEHADPLLQRRDGLQTRRSQTEERKTNLIRRLDRQKERIKELENLLADQQSRAQEDNDKHARASLQAHKKLQALGEEIKIIEKTNAATIAQEWHKARLLRKQSETITKSRTEIGEVRERLALAQLQLSQRDNQVVELQLELERSRETSRGAEAMSQQKVDDLRASFDAEKNSLHEDIKEEKRKGQTVQQELKKSKKRHALKMAKKTQEVALQKAEVCELEATIGELRDELRQGRLTNESHSTISTHMDRKVSELSQSIVSLKAETAMTQQELEGRLIAAQVDIATSREKLKVAASELHDVQKELATTRQLAASLSSRSSGTDVIRAIGHHLKQLSRRADKCCNSSHHQYHYLTDCNTLLCSDCLRQALPEAARDMPLDIGPKEAFEIDCPWCRSDIWTWEALTIPFSTSWIDELDSFIDTISSFEHTRVTADLGGREQGL